MSLHTRSNRTHPRMYIWMHVNSPISPYPAPGMAVDEDGMRRPHESRAKPPSPTAECRADGDSGPEVDRTGNRYPRARRRKDHDRIVVGHVEQVRIDWKDLDISST